MQPFGHNRNDRKLGKRLCSLFGEGRAGSHLTQSRLGWGLAPYQVASWSMQPFGRNRYGPKIGWGCAPLGSPSNTMWPGPRPTCMPSFILIRPAVWPQRTNVTDRQWTDSIGRTVLQTVAQNGGGARAHPCQYVPAKTEEVVAKMSRFWEFCDFQEVAELYLSQQPLRWGPLYLAQILRNVYVVSERCITFAISYAIPKL